MPSDRIRFWQWLDLQIKCILRKTEYHALGVSRTHSNLLCSVGTYSWCVGVISHLKVLTAGRQVQEMLMQGDLRLRSSGVSTWITALRESCRDFLLFFWSWLNTQYRIVSYQLCYIRRILLRTEPDPWPICNIPLFTDRLSGLQTDRWKCELFFFCFLPDYDLRLSFNIFTR